MNDTKDIRTERGDLVPEKWEEWYEAATRYKWMPNRQQFVDLITELASWQARVEQLEKELKDLKEKYNARS